MIGSTVASVELDSESDVNGGEHRTPKICWQSQSGSNGIGPQSMQACWQCSNHDGLHDGPHDVSHVVSHVVPHDDSHDNSHDGVPAFAIAMNAKMVF